MHNIKAYIAKIYNIVKFFDYFLQQKNRALIKAHVINQENIKEKQQNKENNPHFPMDSKQFLLKTKSKKVVSSGFSILLNKY